MSESKEPSDEEMLEVARDLMGEHAEALSALDDEPRPKYTEDAYPDWSRESTFVLSGPLGKAIFSGTRYANWQEAKQSTANRFSVVQFWTCGQRWFARVRRTGPLANSAG